MHKIHLFNLGKAACHYNDLYIDELRNILSYDLISNGYFYIQWMFPVIGNSKWHTNVEPFTISDNKILKEDHNAINNIIKSADLVLNCFSIRRVGSNYCCINDNEYWLRGIGHEEKKISRIAICLMQLGILELSESLIKTSCEHLENKGFKTKRDTKNVTLFWENLKDSQILY